MSCDKNFPMSSQIFYSLTNMNNLYTTYQKRKKKKKGGGNNLYTDHKGNGLPRVYK